MVSGGCSWLKPLTGKGFLSADEEVEVLNKGLSKTEKKDLFLEENVRV